MLQFRVNMDVAAFMDDGRLRQGEMMRLREAFALAVVAVLTGQAATADAQTGRLEYTMSGIGAWSYAKDHSFQFQPLHPDWGFSRDLNDYQKEYSEITEPFDGRDTRLRTYTRTCGWALFTTCVWSPRETLASVTAGTLVVHKPQTTANFLLFDRRKLAPGWTVKSVDLYAGTFARRPAYGTDDMSFIVRLRSYSYPLNAHVRAIVLEGPSNAASWQDAFK